MGGALVVCVIVCYLSKKEQGERRGRRRTSVASVAEKPRRSKNSAKN